MIFESSTMYLGHSTLKTGKNLAKNEEKPCLEFLQAKKLKFSAKLVNVNAILR